MTTMPFSGPEFQHFSINDFPSEVRDQSRQVHLAEGELLFQEGDPAEAIYFLETGSIRLLNYTGTGKTVEYYSVEPGEFCAEVLALITVCTCTAIAEKMSHVLVIPKTVWIEALKTHHNLAVAYTKELTYRLYQVTMILRLRGIRAARERVWEYLRVKANPQTKTVHLDRSSKAIARDLDLTPETLSRVLGQLTRDRWIQRDAKTITLLKLAS